MIGRQPSPLSASLLRDSATPRQNVSPIFLYPSTTTLRRFLCAYLCVLCASALKKPISELP
jgi:hypothetical protein